MISCKTCHRAITLPFNDPINSSEQPSKIIWYWVRPEEKEKKVMHQIHRGTENPQVLVH